MKFLPFAQLLYLGPNTCIRPECVSWTEVCNSSFRYKLFVTTVSGDSSSAAKEFAFEIEKLDYPNNIQLISQTNSTFVFQWDAVSEAEVSTSTHLFIAVMCHSTIHCKLFPVASKKSSDEIYCIKIGE